LKARATSIGNAKFSRIDKHGHDTLRAEELLSTFEETLALHIEDRDRLRKDLRESSGA